MRMMAMGPRLLRLTAHQVAELRALVGRPSTVESSLSRPWWVRRCPGGEDELVVRDKHALELLLAEVNLLSGHGMGVRQIAVA